MTHNDCESQFEKETFWTTENIAGRYFVKCVPPINAYPGKHVSPYQITSPLKRLVRAPSSDGAWHYPCGRILGNSPTRDNDAVQALHGSSGDASCP
jgi:hypothetical protein